MTKAKNNKKNIYIGIIIAIISLVILFRFAYIQKDSPFDSFNSNYSMSKNYTFSTLKFSINVPNDYRIDDKSISINLIKGKNEINIGRNGTNHQNIDNYLNDLGSKNKIVFVDRENLTIGNYDAIKTIIKHPISGDPDNLTYFIYKDYFIYRFSTSNKELFDDLDQIARSFRYTP